MQIAYHDRDAELLDLILSVDSDIKNEQLREVTNRNSMAIHFIKTMDFDIWVALASNATIFTPHNECSIFQTFMQFQTENPGLFRKSMIWWYCRFGPSMP